MTDLRAAFTGQRVVLRPDYEPGDFCELASKERNVITRYGFKMVCEGKAYPVQVVLPDGNAVLEFRMRYTLDYLVLDKRHNAYIVPVATATETMLMPESFDYVIEHWETWRPRRVHILKTEPFAKPYEISYPYDPEGKETQEYAGIIETHMGRFLLTTEHVYYLAYSDGKTPVYQVIAKTYDRILSEEGKKELAEKEDLARDTALFSAIEIAILRDLGLLY